MGDYELKPCPFCGSKNISITVPSNHGGWDGPPRYIIKCKNCFAETDLQCLSKNDTLTKWNRRYEPPNPPLTLDELRELEGEPVWISFVNHPNSGFWDVVETCWELFYTLHLKMYGALPLEEIGKTWLAYRRRPEDISKKEAQNGQTNHP